MDLKEQMPDSGGLFLRNWLLSYAKCRHRLSPKQRAKVMMALIEHIEKVDRADQALATMAAKRRGGNCRS